MIVCSEQYAKRMNIHSMARIVAGTVTGVHPKMMGIGPISAGRKLSDRTGGNSRMSTYSKSTRRSSQSIATISELGLDYDRNIHGGSIAIKHPLGASGAGSWGKLRPCSNQPMDPGPWPSCALVEAWDRIV